MVVPDFGMICEIMLMSEGFIDARLLARKFITLYELCRELLSKQVWFFLPIFPHMVLPFDLSAHMVPIRIWCY